jgi:hypothetical protein
MNVQFTRGSGVATITLSAGEIAMKCSSRCRRGGAGGGQHGSDEQAEGSPKTRDTYLFRQESAGNRQATASGRTSESTWS